MASLASRGDPAALADPAFAQRCLESLLSGPEAVIYVKDLASRFVLVSDATAAKHGMSPAELVGLTDADLFTSEHADFALAEERHIMTTGEPTAYKEVHETWPDRPDSWAVTTKRPLHDDEGRIVGLVGISQDITGRILAERAAAAAMDDLRASEARLKAAQEELARQALTDPVTGLANRVLLTERVTRAIARLRGDETVAVIFVDLDRFKEVNDVHGHHVGDAVLVEVARRLGEAARRGDTVARLGGDEFVVLCEALPDGTVALEVARRFVDALGAPFDVEGGALTLSASVGVVPVDERSGDVAAVLRRADAAMYAAKRSGGNRAHLAEA